MKHQLGLLFLLAIFFQANSTGTSAPAAFRVKAPARSFRAAPDIDTAVPGCTTKKQLLFDDIRAILRDQLLMVSWISPASGNGNCFEVQASEDRVAFATIGSVEPGRPDDNANGDFLYAASIPAPAYPVSMAGLLLIATAFFRISKKRMMVALFIVLTLGSAIIACYHKDQVTVGPEPVRFIRIAVTDKDGMRSYSEVVKVHKGVGIAQ
ncbi:hypothetical protein [Niabella drilacis]|uniref:PEP-CTERM protein-sorting domain-containing protein n=1 Tax=Niabella drilacis (strain DSM 25811 / CCM 8410 / CCUG 62505 / LMG 26954 / E90) TaxID=1285928 RepID=A0A1G6YX20_NIADE|nr:hypothetical protein [Niabella drilacis]SDD94185.1 hypothetical protein SAMN04487894_116106 [Niabella drilacis]